MSLAPQSTISAPAAEPPRGSKERLLQERFSGPLLVMAPMEGVHDVAMRALMTELGGFGYGVTEFVRISQDVPGPAALLAHAPELSHNARSPSGVPIDVQLLGSDLERMAQAAVALAALGTQAVDLNFGCPAKTVNRHDGGATLLKSAQRVFDVVAAVRRAVPEQVAVSAKLRLGWEDPDDIDANAAAAVEAGADWLTIHGRTKAQGYRPPALWLPIARVAQKVAVPVIANGDLFTVEDVLRCRAETGLQHFMLGRGALADPTLAPRAAAALGIAVRRGEAAVADRWSQWLERYVLLARHWAPRRSSLPGRLKQWGMMALRHGGSAWVQAVKRLQDPDEILAGVRAYEAGLPAIANTVTQTL